ncbi:MAG TPA: hypothetical protein VFF83_02085 [Clostridia bacterium]|nr:hypothetical protein [Clostridia bacterium]
MGKTDNNRYIYLVFSKTGTWLSRALRMFVKTKYVHASISLDSSLKSMYSFGRLHADNPFSGGFVEENFNFGVFKKNRNCECIVYRIGVTQQQYDTLLNELINFLELRESYRYNFFGLFTAGMGVLLKREKYYFCSQFVSELLIKSGIISINRPPELIRPTDLLGIETKEKVFEGFVWKYRASENELALYGN